MNNFNCYLYLGYNFNLKKNKNLLKYNSKNLNIYQNSHWDENFKFVDIILPNILFFEKRTYLYINCLGLLKRITPLLSNKYSFNFLTDIEIITILNFSIPNFSNILKIKSISNLINLIPIGNLEKNFDFNNIFKIKLKLNINKNSFFVNNVFNVIYKNFYNTNIITNYSENMNILSYTFFEINSNFKL